MANVWNAALKERVESYAASQKDTAIKPVNHKFGQYHHIDRKSHPEYNAVNILALQAVLSRLHDSYKSFFVLIKKDPTARPPREKGLHRVIELGIINKKPFGWLLEGDRLTVKGLGTFRLRLHRPVEGTIKTVTITFRNGFWYVCFSCQVQFPVVPQPHENQKKIRLFFEPYLFIKDSQGQTIEHPRFYHTEIERLRRLSRALSRKKKGSKNRKKARHTLGKWHEHIKNKRKYFLESVANRYIQQYDVIEIPKLPLKQTIQQAATSSQTMRLCDAAYGIFCSKLKFAAQKSGRQIIEYAL